MTATPKQKDLQRRWDAIMHGAAQAIDWIQSVRPTAPRLDSEADNLNLRLHRARNLARSLARVAARPMTIGFFGLSQAGKSHLISVLAAGENGRLETRYGDRPIDFLKHVNPVGGGKEATGLVTRFSRSATSGSDDFPVELSLFGEIELAKLLVNSYFNDFDQQRIDYEITENRIQSLLQRFENTNLQQEHPGVSVGDVVSLYDYSTGCAEKALKKLDLSYWPRAFELAPRLPADQRAELFSILWGEESALTDTYKQLAATLRRLGNRERAFAPLDALVRPDGSQADSIMNVDILGRLGSPSDIMISVRPAQGESLDPPVSVTLAELAAVTAELTFPLVNPTRDPQVEQVDLLDFPGYRGRLSIMSVADADANAGARNGNPVSQLILRSKVAYLFERYTDSQEMNGLVLCASGFKQSDVNDVGPVLTRWIEKTQGINPAERAQRESGLMWAVTMMDLRIQDSLPHSEGRLREVWEGLIKIAMLERFGQFSWMREWQPGRTFDSTFMLRKPGEPVPFLTMKNGIETGVNTEYSETLKTMGDTFAISPSVIAHVTDPAKAWEGLLALNDGGLSHLSAHLAKIANLEFKLRRIEEQLHAVLDGLVDQNLGAMLHKGGAEARETKQETANMLGQALERSWKGLAELVHHLEVPADRLRDLYLGGDRGEADSADQDGGDANSGAAPNPSPFGGSSPFGSGSAFGQPAPPLGSPAGASAAAPEQQSNDHRFARAAFRAWVAHLRELPQRNGVLRLLGIDKKVMEAIVDELITAANRLDLETGLRRALVARAQSGARKDQLVSRQVLTAQLKMRDFVSWLGNIELPVDRRPNSLLLGKQPIFSDQQGITPGQQPDLPDQARDYALQFAADWISALYYATLENAGHAAGSEISIDQNDRLEAVLKTFRAGATHAA